MKDLKPSSTECIYGSCEAPQSSTLDLPLCDRHAIKAYRSVKAALELADQDQPAPFVGSGNARPLHKTTTQGVVYFMEFGDRIKIGFSTNVEQRARNVPNDRVLATIPGTLSTEAAMHARFAADRIHHEWFRKSADLMAYITDHAA